MLRQYELVDRVRQYDPQVDEDRLNRAYVYATQKHGSQLRASGDPYFSHPIEVAGILTKMRLDTDTIITGLLHDTVEDTDATLEEIEKLFGGNVARLVDGVTKLSQIKLRSDKTKQAENFRKLVLAMSEDIRVLLVKLADRLHNMQTLHFVPRPEKRHRIALETLEIYAPLSERIGMHDMKDMLQDLSFRELHPQARESILTRLEFLRENGGSLKNDIVRQLQEDLREAEVNAVVYGREKKPYSIWRKMQKKNITLEQLSDIMAFRVIVDSVAQCYAALGTIHSKYTIVPGRFKDYISMPKANGYQSLHTTVIGPYGHRIEVQIRTNDMHEVAELGVAAHWVYKQGAAHEGAQFTWMRDLLDVLDTASSPEEFLEHTKIAMFQDQVFCFSPKGDLVALPKDATPVDFAYAVHSEVGDACVGAKVNGRIVPLRTPLRNGDQVDIITQRGHQPSPSWEGFVVSAKAKSHIRRFIRNQRRQQYLELGRALLQKAFKDAGRPYAENVVATVVEKFKAPTLEELLVIVGEGQISARDILLAVYPEIQKAEALLRQDAVPTTKKKKRSGASLPIKGLIPGMAMHYAKCCHPVPGDRIVGIVTTGKGVTIHTIDCDTLTQFQEQPHRWIDVAWEDTLPEETSHVARLHVIMENEPGNLGSMCTIIGQNQANIHNLKIVNRSYDLYELLIDVEVKDARHIATIMAGLRANRGVNAVERARQ